MQCLLLSRTRWTSTLRSQQFRRPALFHSTPRSQLHFTNVLKQETRSELPSFREKVAPEIQPEAFTEKVGKPGARKQVVFVVSGTLLAFGFAALNTNVETAYWKQRLASPTLTWPFSSITTTDIRRARQAAFLKDMRERFDNMTKKIIEMPAMLRPWIAGGLVAVMQPIVDASEGKRLCWKLCLLNAAVWVAWKVPRWQPAMAVRFMHNPLSGLALTLLTSMFSHRNFLHLLLNCLALEGFGAAAYYFLAKEQGKQQPYMLESSTSHHFLAYFVSAGLFSGLVSHVVATKFRYPRLVAQLASEAQSAKKVDTWAAAVSASSEAAKKTVVRRTVPDILPSLGASGAIYATVTTTALAFPDSQIALIIPPSYPINIQWGVGGLILMDTIGVLRGWRVFDHWAHLGGAAFGAAYYAFGPRIWHSFRRALEIQIPEQKKT